MPQSPKPLLHKDSQRNIALWAMLVIGAEIGLIWGFLLGRFVGAILCAAAMDLVVLVVYRVLVEGSGRTVGGLLVPDSRANPNTSYSHIDALEARGDIAGAVAAWEEVIAASTETLAARLRAAELYAGKAKNPVRAAELFREAQQHRNASDETRRYVTQRLIDLYLGPLNDELRALTELRRITERWPNTPEARGALTAIANIEGRR